jgi:smad nuclear-interacting protein 1
MQPNYEPTNNLRKQYKDGILLKFIGTPQQITQRFRLYCYKQGKLIDTIILNAFETIGKLELNTIVLAHESISQQHCALQYKGTKLYLVDFSSNGTWCNGKRVPSDKYYELLPNDCIKFGMSTREYVVIKE